MRRIIHLLPLLWALYAPILLGLEENMPDTDWQNNFSTISIEDFKLKLETEFAQMQSIKDLQTLESIKTYWHSFIQPMKFDKASPYPIYSLLYNSHFEFRLEKFTIYLRYGAAVPILSYENMFFHIFNNYYLYSKNILGLEHLKILKYLLGFKDHLELPWGKSFENSVPFFQARKNWIDQYGIRLALHFIDNQDWRAYRTIMRAIIGKQMNSNMNLLFYNNEFLPPVKRLMESLSKSIIKNKQHLNAFKWTLANVGNQILRIITKNPKEFHSVMAKLSHEFYALNNAQASPIWDKLNGSYHLFHFAIYNKRDIFQWLIYYYDYSSLAHLLHWNFIHEIPKYPNNSNLLHFALTTDHDTEMTQKLSKEEQEYRVHRFIARLLWHDKFPIIERIKAVLTQDKSNGKTPLDLVDATTKPKIYRTLKHFLCVYETFNSIRRAQY